MDTPDVMRSVLASLRRAGARYADARYVENRREHLRVRNEEIEAALSSEDRGVGFRVAWENGWGFACTPDERPDALARTAREALAIARATSAFAPAAPRGARPFDAPEPAQTPARGTFDTAVAEDPFAMPLDDKLAHLFQAAAILGTHPAIRAARAGLTFIAQRKLFLSTEGHELRQNVTLSGGGIAAVAVRGADAQARSYPKDGEGDVGQGGFERVRAMDLPGNAARVREEAIALLSAPDCPSGEQTLLLSGAQLSLQVHESCGHALELDRALGQEASLAGGTYLTPDRLGSAIAAPCVTLLADATTPGAAGTFGWDDEGTAAQRTALVRDGVFVGYLSDRLTAPSLGGVSSGAARAESWSRVPLVRMTNVDLLPGPAGGLEDLVADTRDGLLFDVNRSWSIDAQRLHFHFGVEAAWEIKRGRRTQLLRNAVYEGVTPDFWRACDVVTGPGDWRSWGYLFCGKGDPMQLMWTGHGVPSARFRRVRVGARR